MDETPLRIAYFEETLVLMLHNHLSHHYFWILVKKKTTSEKYNFYVVQRLAFQ